MFRLKRHHVLLAVIGLLAVLLALAGCGGGHSKHVSVAPLQLAGHTCTPQDTAMQCVLAKQPGPKLTFAAPFATAFGWDFAWSCPDPAGKAFGWSYLSYDTSKNWTRGCINLYHSRGAATVAGWETSATRTLDGYSAGFSDARAASTQLAGLGAPAGQPFTMAIDFDANGSEVASYFQGANVAEPGRINAYGGYRPLLYLYQHGLIGHLNFQTYAWSNGAWLPASIAPLEQYLNSSAVDYDRAIGPNYGQWPYSAPNPGPSPAQVRGWIGARGKSLHAYYQHGCRTPVLASGTCGQLAWRVDHFQKLVDTNHHGYFPRCFGKHRDLGAAECQVARPAVAVWSRAVNSTVKVEGGCESARGPVHNRRCNTLRARETYFRHRISHTLGTSRL